MNRGLFQKNCHRFLYQNRSFSTKQTPNDLILKTIQSNQVVIFSKTYCPYCANTKKLFSLMNIQPNVIELDQIEEGNEIQSALERLTNQRTVPNVFVNGQHVGGNDNTVKAKASGELDRLLALKSW